MPDTAALLRHAHLAARAWAVGSAAMALASLAGAFIAPLDLLNQIAWVWLWLALVGSAVAWFAIERGKLRLHALAALGFAAFTHIVLIAPEFTRQIPDPVQPTPETPRIRVVWLNAQAGTAAAPVLDYLRATSADFVLMSEYYAEAGTPELARHFPYAATCEEPHACNVMILSRRVPLATRPPHETSPSDLRVVWADFDIDGAPLRLVGTHLRRPYPASRQAAQRAELLSLLAGAAPENTILAGDFNTTPWSFALKRFDARSGLTRYDRAMGTWPATPWTRFRLPAPAAFMPIDHIYAGGHWRLVSIRRGPRAGADHYPIEAEFAWVGGA